MNRLIIALALACVACDEGFVPVDPPVEDCTDLCAAICRCGVDWRENCKGSCVDHYFEEVEMYECAFDCVAEWYDCHPLRWCLWDCPGNVWTEWES